jgi:hypothetical protein
MLTRATRFCLLVLLVLLGSFTIAAARSETVALGSDYFQTVPGSGDSSGTWFNFGAGIGVVDFQGAPNALGQTDTWVIRQADATINGPAIPIQLMDLSLVSEAPVLVSGNLYNVSLSLNPADKSKGSITILGSTSGGTFNSTLNVFFDANFTPVKGGSPFQVQSEVTISGTDQKWLPTPPPGAVIVPGPYGQPWANLHSGLPPGEVDFFGDPMECSGSNGCHVVVPAELPEPPALLLVVPAVVGMFWKLRSTLV